MFWSHRWGQNDQALTTSLNYVQYMPSRRTSNKRCTPVTDALTTILILKVKLIRSPFILHPRCRYILILIQNLNNSFEIRLGSYVYCLRLCFILLIKLSWLKSSRFAI